jgi:hypothetical protein
MTAIESIDLQRAAKEHLWMHFTRMGGYETARRRLLPGGRQR